LPDSRDVPLSTRAVSVLQELKESATGAKVFNTSKSAVEQARCLVGREQRPFRIRFDTFHEQIRHPVGGVHVMGASAVVTSVFAQVEKLLNVDVPGLEVGADRSLALTALVDGN